MRKIIEYCLLSADGVHDNPNPVQMNLREFQDDAYLRDTLGLLEACEATLWGRTTYEIFAKIYGGGGGNPTYAARLNAMRKYVFSSKLEMAGWNNTTIIRGDVLAEATKLKQQAGGNLLVLGHGRLGETLLKHGLLDMLDLSIHPLMVGRGQGFFRDGQAMKLKLTATKTFSNIVKLTYEPQYSTHFLSVIDAE